MKLLVISLLLALTGCAHQVVPPDAHALHRALTGERLEIDFSKVSPVSTQNPFELSPDMQAFADLFAPAWMSDERKATSLHKAILGNGGLNMNYDPYATSSAARTFDLQSGNCLSYTILYYSMARHVGVRAYINQVDVPATWDLIGDNTYVFFRHVNVRVKLRGGDDLILDLDMDNYNQNYRQGKISEKELTVQYFNNIGMEGLRENDYERAFVHLRQAIRIDDSHAYVWSNLGTLYRRLKLFQEAEAAYLQALNQEPNHRTSLSNLARLYEQMGLTEKANQYTARVAHYRANNPYNRYHLAEQAYAAGDYDYALKEIKKAIEGFEEDHRFHHLAGLIYLSLADKNKARQSYEKASLYSKADLRMVYERKLKILSEV